MNHSVSVIHDNSSYWLYLLFRKLPKPFAFDFCFDSIDAQSNQFTTQNSVFKSIGEDILDDAFQGYNACVFAYGQTGMKI